MLSVLSIFRGNRNGVLGKLNKMICMISALNVFPVSTTCQKYDYDSSTVRKKFFREALLQIMIPYMLQHLKPSCSPVSSTQHSI